MFYIDMAYIGMAFVVMAYMVMVHMVMVRILTAYAATSRMAYSMPYLYAAIVYISISQNAPPALSSLTAPRIQLLPTCQATVYSVQQQPI